VGWVGDTWAAAQDGKNGPQALSAGLGDSEHVQSSLAGRSKVWGTVYIEVEIERTTYDQGSKLDKFRGRGSAHLKGNGRS